MPERPDIANWPLPRRTRPRRTCFLSSQMNAIRGFSAPRNGVRPGHLAKMSSRQKQETRGGGLNGTHSMINDENLFHASAPTKPFAAPTKPFLCLGEDVLKPRCASMTRLNKGGAIMLAFILNSIYREVLRTSLS